MVEGVQFQEYHDQSLPFLEGDLPRHRNLNLAHDFYVLTQTVQIGQKSFALTKA